MLNRLIPIVMALACFLAALAVGAPCRAQDAGKAKDEALDSLIEKLAAPRDKDPSKTGKSPEGAQKARRARSCPVARASKPRARSRPPRPTTPRGASPPLRARPARISSLPRTKKSTTCYRSSARPTTLRPPTSVPAARPAAIFPRASRRPPSPTGPKLGEKDKAIDERLEEYTGRKKKRPAGDEERKGPIGEIIKEMRDVEKRLGKPDPSEDTRNKQKQIVKRIDTLIEQARQSGSAMGQLVLRRVRQAGPARRPAARRPARCASPRALRP